MIQQPEWEYCWVITSSHGLYAGQHRRRKDMITQHVREKFTYPRYPRDEERRALWRKCRALGDRAVKATLTWECP